MATKKTKATAQAMRRQARSMPKRKTTPPAAKSKVKITEEKPPKKLKRKAADPIVEMKTTPRVTVKGKTVKITDIDTVQKPGILDKPLDAPPSKPQQTNPNVVVQAKDGKWHFGPPWHEELMRSEEKGKFKSAADASQGATKTEDPSSSPKVMELIAAQHVTGVGSGIMLDVNRNYFIPVKDDLWLTIDGGSVDVVRIEKGSEKHKRWIPYEGGCHRVEASQILEKSFLPKTPAAARAIVFIQGRGPLEETKATLGEAPTTKRERKVVSNLDGTGFTLAQLCTELKLEGTEVRKVLRAAKVQKPGARWEWPTREAAKDVIALVQKEMK